MVSDNGQFLAARDMLLQLRRDYEGASERFRWPKLDTFNWANDYFDLIDGADKPALRIVRDDGGDITMTFAAVAMRSRRVANFLAGLGIGQGDRLLVMLGNVPALWETLLAVMRRGAVMIPTPPLLSRADLADRLERGAARVIVADAAFCARFDGLPGPRIRIAVGGHVDGWIDYSEADNVPTAFKSVAVTRADDPLLIYFTSGTTARAKMVVHTHASYPVGHLSTMYWLGLQPGDVHLNLSSPGWAKHAWSCVFGPWNAGATVLAYHFERFQAKVLLDQLVRCKVTTFCAPPTVWRMLIQEDLHRWPVTLREITSAGEPLNPEVIEQVRSAWGITMRDGFGQSETTAMIGNSPGQSVTPGCMGRPLPGYKIALLGSDGLPSTEGEICVELNERPVGLMLGYLGDAEKTGAVIRDGYYHTGDVATSDPEGYLTYVGRMDDLFKSSDYRISPFELESVLLEHPAVAEAAVVPSPDPIRLSVPKAFVVLASGYRPDATVASSILAHVRERVSPFKRIRRLEFADLPKTISGKIRRVDLRRSEEDRPADERRVAEFWEEDFPHPSATESR